MRSNCNTENETLFDERPSDPDAAGETFKPDEMLGTVIDERYRIESVLGRGGMGVVFGARHTRLGKALAVKVLRAGITDENAFARFQLEAESASAIGNAHIVDVSDFGTLPQGSTYFVMEHLNGVGLTEAIDTQGPMPFPRACGIAIQLCRALGAAHEAGIVHRDLKPENVVLVARDGNPDFVKVLDFGIAKVTHTPNRLTRDTDLLGTPHYMSPEQCEGLAIDHRTDIYSLGVLLYEMVAARVPHDADTAMAILHKHVYERPTPIDLYVTGVPASLKRVIARCLEKKPERRYPSMEELQSDLERVMRGETARSLGSRGSWRDLTRRPGRLSGAALAFAIVATFGVIWAGVVSKNRAQPLRDHGIEVTVEEPERGVPDALARPVEQPATARFEPASPPASLVRPAEPPPREAARRTPKTRRKKASNPATPTRAKPAQQADDVLDPWM